MMAPTEASEWGAAPPPRRLSVALFLAGFATFSLLYCMQPLLPDLSRDFRVGPAASSLAVSLTTGALALSIMVAGAASEALGRRGLMGASMGLAAGLNLLCAVAPGWTALLVVRAAEGVALGGVPAVAMAYLAEEVAPARLGAVMGLYVGGTALGGMAGRVAIGLLTQLSSWRVAVGTVSALDLLAAAAFAVLLPPSRRFRRSPGFDLGVHLGIWRAQGRDVRLLLLFLVGFLAMSAFVTVYNYAGFRLALPPYGLDQAQVGLIFFCYVLGVVASPLAGRLADRAGRATVTAAGALLLLAGLGLTALRPLAAVVAGVAVVTAGFFTVHAVASGWVGRLAGRGKGHAASLYLLAYYAGSSVMGSLGGAVWHAGGWNGVVVYAGVLVLGILLAAMALARLTAEGRA